MTDSLEDRIAQIIREDVSVDIYEDIRGETRAAESIVGLLAQLKYDHDIMLETFKREGAFVMLDGRNEHGTHLIVIRDNGYDMAEIAKEWDTEGIFKDAESKGFEVGDVVWVDIAYQRPEYDGPNCADPGGHYIAGVDEKISRVMQRLVYPSMPSPMQEAARIKAKIATF